MNKCDKKMLDVFWMNIWPLDNHNASLGDEVRKIVGNENVKIVNGLLLFRLREELSDFDIMTYDGSRQKLNAYLRKKDLLL